MREWNELELDEKLDVLRQLVIAQSALGMNNLAILCEKGLSSPDEIEETFQGLWRAFEYSQVGDAADISRFKQRLEHLMIEVRESLDGK